MEVKGTSLRGTIDFVKNHFPERYNEWLAELPKDANNLFTGLVLTNKWYPIETGLVKPIETISRLFYNNELQKTAHFMGRCHAELTLTGLYKFFVQMNTPLYILERGVSVLHTYFQPLSVSIKIYNNNSASLIIHPYELPHIVFEASIAGWTEKAIEISGGKNVRSEIPLSLSRSDEYSEILFYWE